VLGGRGARAAVDGEGAEAIADALRALTLDVERIGDDVLIAARLTEW
jgi:diaminohydroxyphosphoribosylaminopyrimidine deaminase/5-amino-6-(5-phosphoribosylamino)uracil reductase